MKTVYKYLLASLGQNYAEVYLPEGAEVIRIDEQNTDVYLWAIVDPSKPCNVHRVFRLYATGATIGEDKMKFVNTFMTPGRNLVYHAFEVLDW